MTPSNPVTQPPAKGEHSNVLHNVSSEWERTENAGEVPCNSRMIDGVLCRWWGSEVPPGVATIDAAAGYRCPAPTQDAGDIMTADGPRAAPIESTAPTQGDREIARGLISSHAISFGSTHKEWVAEHDRMETSIATALAAQRATADAHIEQYKAFLNKAADELGLALSRAASADARIARIVAENAALEDMRVAAEARVGELDDILFLSTDGYFEDKPHQLFNALRKALEARGDPSAKMEWMYQNIQRLTASDAALATAREDALRLLPGEKVVFVGFEWLCGCNYSNIGPICTKCMSPNPHWQKWQSEHAAAIAAERSRPSPAPAVPSVD